jgi:uncharacterized protein YciI
MSNEHLVTRVLVNTIIFAFIIIAPQTVKPSSSAEGAVKNRKVVGEEEIKIVDTKYFVFLYHRGPEWIQDKPVIEQPFIKGHFDHMTKLESDGILVIGGAFKDESGAMGILEVVDMDEAQQIVNSDPVIKNKTLVATVKAWHPSVAGCVELREW